MALRLRCKAPTGATVALALPPATLLTDLLSNISTQLGYPISLKSGFPPKPLPITPGVTLHEAGLRDGETLVVVKEAKIDVAVKVVADDNSCLFSAIAVVVPTQGVPALRSIIADAIQRDPINYSDAMLGKSRADYCRWICGTNAWGGAIELAIFASHFGTAITSIDVMTGRLDRFGEGDGYDKTVYLMYSGIHYDAIIRGSQTSFNSDESGVVEGEIRAIANKWRAEHKFTDVGRFSLRCEICSIGLVGESGAQQHATATGHTAFKEYQ